MNTPKMYFQWVIPYISRASCPWGRHPDCLGTASSGSARHWSPVSELAQLRTCLCMHLRAVISIVLSLQPPWDRHERLRVPSSTSAGHWAETQWAFEGSVCLTLASSFKKPHGGVCVGEKVRSIPSVYMVCVLWAGTRMVCGITLRAAASPWLALRWSTSTTFLIFGFQWWKLWKSKCVPPASHPACQKSIFLLAFLRGWSGLLFPPGGALESENINVSVSII